MERIFLSNDWFFGLSLAATEGMKTMDAMNGHVGRLREIKPSLREFEALVASEEKVGAR